MSLSFKRVKGGLALLSPRWAVGVFYSRPDDPMVLVPQWSKAYGLSRSRRISPLPVPVPIPPAWSTSTFTFPSPTKEAMVGTQFHLPGGRSIWWVRATGRKMSLMKRLAVKAAAAKLKRELKKQVEGSMRAEVEFRKIEDLTD